MYVHANIRKHVSRNYISTLLRHASLNYVIFSTAKSEVFHMEKSI